MPKKLPEKLAFEEKMLYLCRKFHKNQTT